MQIQRFIENLDEYNIDDKSKVDFQNMKEGQFDELLIKFPKGTYSGSANRGGLNFYSSPFNAFPCNEITLTYDLYISKSFAWNKGGKLPIGLYGGIKGVNGGKRSNDGFSIRLMWRRNGDGEVYVYLPALQHESFGFNPNVKFSKDKGISIGRGLFRFKKNVFQNISLSVKLNDENEFNGIIELKLDGNTVIKFDNLNIRSNKNINIEGLFFNSFYGGDDETWASPKDTHIILRSVSLIYEQK